MKRVLIVTYFFPPRPGVASLRLRGLAKYLPEFGWEPTILTARLPAEPDSKFKVVETYYPGNVWDSLKKMFGLSIEREMRDQLYDPDNKIETSLRFKLLKLASKIPSERLIGSFIAYPDAMKNWYPFAVEKGEELLKNEKFDAILSSFGPATCHLVACELKKRYNLHWVADFRDLWSQGDNYLYGPIRRLIYRGLEVKTIRYADVLTTVSEPLAQQLRSLHNEKTVMVIPNGFDPDEIGTAPLTKKFTITYTGLIYEGKRRPEILFKAISELISKGLIERENIKVCFYGTKRHLLVQRYVNQFKLEDVVELHPILPRDVVLQKQRESQLLLVLGWDSKDGVGVYTGKVFEYLAAQRPILSVGGPRGVLSSLLEETNTGIHASTHEEVKQALLEFYKQYKAHGYVPYKGRMEQIMKYSHREMARKFAEVLEMGKKSVDSKNR